MNKETKLQNSTQTEEWQKYSKNRQKTAKKKVRCVYLKKLPVEPSCLKK